MFCYSHWPSPVRSTYNDELYQMPLSGQLAGRQGQSNKHGVWEKGLSNTHGFVRVCLGFELFKGSVVSEGDMMEKGWKKERRDRRRLDHLRLNKSCITWY